MTLLECAWGRYLDEISVGKHGANAFSLQVREQQKWVETLEQQLCKFDAGKSLLAHHHIAVIQRHSITFAQSIQAS